MQKRELGPFEVSAIGLGCMSLSHAYGTAPPAEEGAKVLLRALDLGYTFFDTAALYGMGANETLVGTTLRSHRDKFVLASKCGLQVIDGKRIIDSSAAASRKVCDESLRRLGVDVIDLYYLHRWDKKTPIEETISGLADLVKAGKVKTIGLSEVSAKTLRAAHKVYPITALQSEYSPWARNAELGTLAACKELGIAYVAFSPVARGFLTSARLDPAHFSERDIRRGMPRFQGENWAKNLKLLEGFAQVAREADCTMAQLSLAWVLSRGPHVIPIPGTTSLAHLEENIGADGVKLSRETIAKIDALINDKTVAGPRYNAATQTEIDTEIA
ncbi:MAG: aldo/keto reductase [Alphaproteobacteria bacterium]